MLGAGCGISGSVALLDYSCISVEAGLWGNIYIYTQALARVRHSSLILMPSTFEGETSSYVI
jgi:hypothetical protein